MFTERMNSPISRARKFRLENLHTHGDSENRPVRLESRTVGANPLDVQSVRRGVQNRANMIGGLTRQSGLFAAPSSRVQWLSIVCISGTEAGTVGVTV